MFPSKKRLGLALALAALIALLLWKRESLFPEKAIAAGADRTSGSPSSDSFHESRRLASPRPKLEKSVETDPETPAALHFRNFFIRPLHLDGEQGIPLAEAVARVKTEYFATAKSTNEESLPLTVDLSQANTMKPLALKLPRGPVTSVLRLLAAASGNRLVGSGPDFRMEAISEEGRKLAKTFKTKFLDTAGFDSGEGVNFDSLPKATVESDSQNAHSDLKTSLEALGFHLSPDLVVTSDHGEIQISNASAADLELMEAALSLADSDAMHQQVKLSTKVIQTPADFEFPEDAQGTIDETRFQSLMRQLAQTQGTDLMTAPSITARYGQVGTMEIVQGSDDPASPLWSGLRVQFAAQPLGTGTEDSFHLIQSDPNAVRVSDEQPLRRISLSGTHVGNQNSVQVAVVRNPDGSNMIYVHSNQRIDATGRPVDSSGKPINPP